PAFDAWMKTNPLTNPNAPSSPFAMPEYVLALDKDAKQGEEDATATFNRGLAASQPNGEYVFNTVLLALVLFFAAISQRFDMLYIRVLLLVVAITLCLLGIFNIGTYPIQ